MDILNYLPEAVIAIDVDQRLVYVNSSALELFGYPESELLGEPLDRLIPAAQRAVHRAAVQDFASSSRRGLAMHERRTVAGLRRDGTLFPAEASIAKSSLGGQPVVYAIVRDMSAHQAQVDSVTRSERKYRAVMEGCPEAILVADPQSGTVIEVNEAACRLFACTAEELVGLHQTELHPPEMRDYFRQTFREHLERGRVLVPDGRILRRDGVEVPVEISACPMEMEGTIRIVGFFRDITHRVQLDRRLRDALAAAHDASKTKSLFLANMSHELRTPMNSIIGFTELLLQDDQDPLIPAHREYADYVLTSAQHLLTLINDILDLEKIEAGKVQIIPEVISVQGLLAEFGRTMEFLAQRKGVELRVELPAESCAVLADRARTLQVLFNLGSNAVKFNRPGGTVTVTAETTAARDAVRITVSDTGLGIPRERQGELFRPFSRLGAEATTIEGTGIGLSIARKLVELMQGRLEFESDAGQGSRFWFDLPIRPAGKRRQGREEAGPEAALAGPSRTILYIEDNPSSAALVKHLVARIPGARLLAAGTGQLGLEMAEAYAPDLVITDIHLPDISGYEVLSRLRARPSSAGLPVVALSADAMPGDIRRGLASGFWQYLTKPVNIRELRRCIEQFQPPHVGAK